jgi:hypothetical protein
VRELGHLLRAPEAAMAQSPNLQVRIAASVAQAQAQARRIANNPYTSRDEPERRTYSDPTAEQAIGNVDRERRRSSERR